jgi:Fe2+-dicitrate sensor, membrane component
MDKKEVAALIQRYLNGECTPEEAAKVEATYNRVLLKRPDGISDKDYDVIRRESLDYIRDRKNPSLHRNQSKPSWTFVRIAAAAVVLITLAFGAYYYINLADDPGEQLALDGADVDPGGNRATLTLADGTTIDLSADQTGIIVAGKGVTYQDGSAVADGDTEDNGLLTLSTPIGGQYQITLSDGTKVWLNAGTTLTYPSRFTGLTRDVQIVGEAFFHVASDQNKPFRVNSGKQQITVLGTQFNVQAYEDESAIRTTLVEGSVEIAAAGKKLKLVPGEQAVLDNKGMTKSGVDVEAATAWKHGYFKFDGDLKSIMAQISRWYDVEVVFDNNVDTSLELMGRISRDKKLNDILRMFGEVDDSLKFNVKGRRLSVMR